MPCGATGPECPLLPDRSRRNFLIVVGAIFTAAKPVLVQAGKQRFDAVVSLDPADNRFGPRYNNLDAALSAAPSDDSLWTVLICAGRWNAKTTIDRHRVSLKGFGPAVSILEFDAHAGGLSPDGMPWGTDRSATLTVRSRGFTAQDLAIHNTFDYVAARSRLDADLRGANGLQAVALALTGTADQTRFENVRIVGHQDTLLIHAGRHGFRDCRIEGSVDFIFGAGAATFRKCVLHSRFRPQQGADQGCVTAASTPGSQRRGFVFDRCRLEHDSDVPPASVWLGRPWRPTRTFVDGRYGDPEAVASVHFRKCWMGAHIRPERWTHMSFQGRDGERIELQPDEARFTESGSFGPGALHKTSLPPLAQEEPHMP